MTRSTCAWSRRRIRPKRKSSTAPVTGIRPTNLYVTNWGKTPLKITKLDVNGKDDEKIVATLSATGKQLAAMFVPVNGDGTKPNDPALKPGETGVFFIFVDWLPGQDDPDTFDTAITIEQHGERSGSGTIHTAALEINQDDPIVIRSPLLGKNWLAANGPSNTSAHRRAMLPVNGQPHIGQRYAIDWIQLGDDGKAFTGDEHDNKSYHAWDQEIHAVADGKIVEVKDGIPENVPNSGKIAVQITYDTLAGQSHHPGAERGALCRVRASAARHDQGQGGRHCSRRRRARASRQHRKFIGAAPALPGLRRAVVPGLRRPALCDRSIHVRRLQARQVTEAGADREIVASR